MAIHHLTPPLGEARVRGLRAGDTVVLDGTVFGLRDATLIRLFDQRVPPPTDLRDGVVLHTAPNVRKAEGRYEPVSIGTTTSMRMDRFTRPLLERLGVRAIIGKGGLSGESLAAMREFGGCYLAITGGAAALETTQIEAIEEVFWEDLMPECLWRFRVRGLGPLTVAMDAHGQNLYDEVLQRARDRLAGIYARLGL
ncbi:MAG: fumarate hydratase C-terminal domain-containing protein [Candidatus Rokubacteria bacterium]|nr:fumarate hydratase C-terminal domain-containing protein [Candidatus Rokubacteria bacterium]